MPPILLTADYLVIGAGSAGAAVAARLAEDPAVTVVLLEAGGHGRHPFLLTAGTMTLIRDWAPHAWLYPTEADPSRQGRQDVWRRGRGLGGSSGINGMIWARGLPRDFDDWAREGATGWSWAEVLPYFRRAEDALGFDSPLRGRGGPMKVETFRSPHQLNEDLLQAFDRSGVPRVEDINAVEGCAASITQTNQHRGLRWSTERGYLRNRRPNLQIRCGAQVLKVEIDAQRRAKGVVVRNEDGSEQRLAARREIVLCAGALESPALLMRSGIGDPAALQALGLAVLHASPEVGRNLQDHPDLYVEYEVNVPTYSNAKRWHRVLASAAEFLLHRTGPATSPGTHLFAYAHTGGRRHDPDLLIFTAPFGAIHDGTFNVSTPVYSITPSICRPRSRGSVRLASAAPDARPLVQPNLLGDEEDVALIARAIGYLDRIARTEPFARRVVRRLAPDETVGSGRPEALHDYIRRAVSTCHHSCGTCRMGSDPGSVVDPELRVRGIEGLRVADASVFPRITSGNLNAPTIMVGERAADLIRGAAA